MVAAPHVEYGQVGAEEGQALPCEGASHGRKVGARALLSSAVLGALCVAVALSPPGRLLRARGVSEVIGLVDNEPYQCTWSYGEGQGSWEKIWSDEQKDWCCKNRQLGCPTPPLFDCEAGYENRKLGWSPIKKTWCCDNEKRGCADSLCQKEGGHEGPKLYCIAVSRPHGYEPELLAKQLEKCVHIFSCDEWSVVSDMTIWLSHDPEVTTLAWEGPELAAIAGESHNARQFRGLWDTIQRDGRYKMYDWTVKADPDTVFFPDRLKAKLTENQYSGDDDTFFASCGPESTRPLNKGKGFVYGAIEVISRAALTKYFGGLDNCMVGEKEQSWEETMLMDCMQQAGVEMNFGMLDHHLLGDGETCNNFLGGTCSGEWIAMHPFGSIHEWFNCWDESFGPQQEQS